MVNAEIDSILIKLREERELQKIYSNEMAAHIGVSHKTYLRIEKGESDLSLRNFFIICKKLQRKPDYFIEGSNTSYFYDCHYSGNHNIYNLGDIGDEAKKKLLYLAQFILDRTKNTDKVM